MSVLKSIWTIMKFIIATFFTIINIFNLFDLFKIENIFSYLFIENKYYLIFAFILVETIISFGINFMKLGQCGGGPIHRSNALRNLLYQGIIGAISIIGNIIYFINMKNEYAWWILLIVFILELIVPIFLILTGVSLLFAYIYDFFDDLSEKIDSIIYAKKRKEENLKLEEKARLEAERNRLLIEEKESRDKEIYNCLHTLSLSLNDEIEKDSFYFLKEGIEKCDFEKIDDNIGLLEVLIDNKDTLEILKKLKTFFNDNF